MPPEDRRLAQALGAAVARDAESGRASPQDLAQSLWAVAKLEDPSLPGCIRNDLISLKCQGLYLFRSVKNHGFCSDPISVDPICR